jgi:1-acyl-sn-glycerol-3-phosphate acyltransferase
MYFWLMVKVRGVLCFFWKCYVGIIFSFLALGLYPLFLIVLSCHKWKKASFYLFVCWSWAIRILCFYHVKKVKKSAIPKGPYIIISNHTSFLDIFFMYSILPHHPFLFLGKGEILNYPIIKTFFKGLNIPVYRKDRGKSAQSFILAKKAITNNWSLVIFPEGGIPDTNHPSMIPFKRGAFKLAKCLNIPIIPLTFTNHFELFSDPLDLLGSARPGISRVYIHECIPIEKIATLDENELAALCFEIINEPIKKEYPL